MQGVYNILATPFDEQGQLDEDSLRSLVDFQIDKGAHGLTILGIMGEVSKLADAERVRVATVVLEQVRGRIPVIVGASDTGTHKVLEWVRLAERLGAAGIMVAPPTNLRNLDSVADFYKAVAGATQLTLVVQDEPVTSGVIMPASFLAGLGQPYMKLEEAPTPMKISRILERFPAAKMFGGLGGQFFLEELDRGAVGTMTGFSYTEILVQIWQLHSSGQRDAARDLFYRYTPLIRYEGQQNVGLALRKELLRRRGAIKCAAIRAPGMRLDKRCHEELDEVLALCGLA